MKTIVLRSSNNNLHVQVMTDLMGDSQRFTIMDITGREDAEVKAGINLAQLPNTIEEMEQFAKDNNLLMDIVDINGGGSTINSVASVTALAITSTSPLAGGTDGVAYNEQVEVEGGNGPLTYELGEGDSLPVGLVLDPQSGNIHGTPTATGVVTFGVVVSDHFGQTDTVEFSITIA